MRLSSIAGLASLTLLTISNESPAIACSCKPLLPPSEAIEKADAVFTGEAVEIRLIKEWDSYGDEIHFTPSLYTRFEILGVWKGVDRQSVWIRTNPSIASCGSVFEVGRSYLVYAYWSEEHDVLSTGLCTRTARFSSERTPEDFAALPKPSYDLWNQRRERIAAALETGHSTVVDGDVP